MHTVCNTKDRMEHKCMQLDLWVSVYMKCSFLLIASKLVNLTLKRDRSVAARQSSRVHWCEHLSPMWTLAHLWHTGSGHMQAFHPSSLCSYWCCEYTSHDCWLWQHTDSHNPSQKIGPSSFSPGQARPSLHKTLIDLMDLCAVHTPSPNKQSAQDLSPLRQRGSARLPLAKATLCDRLRGQRRSAKLVNFTAGPRGKVWACCATIHHSANQGSHPHSSTNSQVNQSWLKFTVRS